MKRSFNALGLVALPRLDVFTALALGAELTTTAEALSPLPEAVQSALDTLVASHRTLHQSVVKQQRPPIGDSGRARAADATLDRAYRALDQWLGSFALVPETPETE